LTFLKLCGPRAGEDYLIAGPIRQFCSSLPTTISWFFVRYADPRPHLRIRFHSKDGHFDVISAVARWATELMKRQLCESFSFDTYEREIERYGGAAVISLSRPPSALTAYSQRICSHVGRYLTLLFLEWLFWTGY
jgi:lantibiotic biosynthesis protein